MADSYPISEAVELIGGPSSILLEADFGPDGKRGSYVIANVGSPEYVFSADNEEAVEGPDGKFGVVYPGTDEVYFPEPLDWYINLRAQDADYKLIYQLKENGIWEPIFKLIPNSYDATEITTFVSGATAITLDVPEVSLPLSQKFGSDIDIPFYSRSTTNEAGMLAEFSVANAHSINLVTNPNFEAGLTDWSPYNGNGTSTISESIEEFYIGTKSVEVVASAVDDGISFKRIQTTIDQDYTVSVWVKSDAVGAQLKVYTQFWTAQTGGSPAGGSYSYEEVTGEWQRISHTVSAQNSWLEIRIANESFGPQTFYVDAVLLEKTSEIHDYFDGNTLYDQEFGYSWSGAPNNSTSFKNSLYMWRSDQSKFYKLNGSSPTVLANWTPVISINAKVDVEPLWIDGNPVFNETNQPLNACATGLILNKPYATLISSEKIYNFPIIITAAQRNHTSNEWTAINDTRVSHISLNVI